MTAPTSHVEESLKLNPDGVVHLYEIRMRSNGGIIRVKNNDTVTWQGMLFESCPIKITGDDRTAEGADSRPTLTIVNPYGMFTPYILAGRIEYAIVIRKSVLREHLLVDVNIYEQRMWRIRRIVQLLAAQSITVELANMSEAPGFSIPVRQFLPPDFPAVNIS